jgi:hypothetical protein
MSRQFYRPLLQIKHGYQPQFDACKDKQGKMITDKEGIANRWAEYFEELLKENGEEGNIPRTSENNVYLTVQPWVEYPSIYEVEAAIAKLKKNKAPGEETIIQSLSNNQPLLKTFIGHAPDAFRPI